MGSLKWFCLISRLCSLKNLLTQSMSKTLLRSTAINESTPSFLHCSLNRIKSLPSPFKKLLLIFASNSKADKEGKGRRLNILARCVCFPSFGQLIAEFSWVRDIDVIVCEFMAINNLNKDKMDISDKTSHRTHHTRFFEKLYGNLEKSCDKKSEESSEIQSYPQSDEGRREILNSPSESSGSSSEIYVNDFNVQRCDLRSRKTSLN